MELKRKRTLILVFLGLVLGIVNGKLSFAYSDALFRSVMKSEEVKINDVREEEITQLKIIMGRRLPESRKPGILLRLAELYTEKYRFYFLKENEVHHRLLAKGHKPRHVDHKKSKAALVQSINACKAILKSKIPFGKTDQVYYTLGYNYEELGNSKASLAYYKTLVRRFPRSSFAPEAYRNLAESAFSKRRYSKAVSYYQRAAQNPDLPSYSRTLYNLAWAYFKTRRYSQAVETMKRVVDLSESGNSKFVGMRDEALNDLVRFFSEAGGLSEAKAYFSKISDGAEIYIKALAKLSRLYEDRGKYKLALKINSSLLKEYEDEAPTVIFGILNRNVELYRKLNNSSGEEASLKRLVRYYTNHSGDLEDDEESKAIFIRAKNYFRHRATAVHKSAQKRNKNSRKTKAIYSRAADLYSSYIASFLKEPSSDQEKNELSEIQTYRVDCLLASGRDQEAVPELERILKGEGKQNIRREAGASLINIVIRQMDSEKARIGKVSEALEERFRSLSEYFEDEFPDDKLTQELQFKKLKLSVEQAVAKKENERALELAKQYLSSTKLHSLDKGGGFRKYCHALILRADFRRIQGLEKDEDYTDAAKEYEKLAASSKDPEVTFKALNNAAVNYVKSKNFSDAKRIYFHILRKYPKSAHTRHIKAELKRLVSVSLWNSQYRLAIKGFNEISHNHDFSFKEQFGAFRTAYRLALGTKQVNEAISLGEKGLARFCRKKTPPACKELYKKHIDLLLKNGKGQDAIELLRSLSSDVVFKFKLAETYAHYKENRKASKFYHEVAKAKLSKKQIYERNLAARAAFIEVEPYFTKFQNVKLELPESRLKAATRQKLAQLESLVIRYQSVVKYGDGEWAIAALERLSDAFANFSYEIKHAPIPPNLPSDKMEAYKREILGVSSALATRALEFLEQGYKKGLSLEVTTPTFIALTQRLSQYKTQVYPPAHYTLKDVFVFSQNEDAEKNDVLKLVGPYKSDKDDWREEIAQKLTHDPNQSSHWVEFGNLELSVNHPELAEFYYSQALELNPKNALALNNLSVIYFHESRFVEAVQGLKNALALEELNAEIKLNYAKTLLAFHHFPKAESQLKTLYSRFPKNQEIGACYAAALVGTGNLAKVKPVFETLDAEDSDHFPLWYNWSVWAVLAGNQENRENAKECLEDRKDDLLPMEKSHAELLLKVAK